MQSKKGKQAANDPPRRELRRPGGSGLRIERAARAIGMAGGNASPLYERNGRTPWLARDGIRAARRAGPKSAGWSAYSSA